MIEYLGGEGSGAARSAMPLSPAVRAGDFVFVSGQVPTDERGEIVWGNVETQTRVVMEKLRTALGYAGCTLADVVKTTVYLADARDFRLQWGLRQLLRARSAPGAHDRAVGAHARHPGRDRGDRLLTAEALRLSDATGCAPRSLDRGGAAICSGFNRAIGHAAARIFALTLPTFGTASRGLGVSGPD